MTWEQTAEVLAREVDRLQKRVDQLVAGIQEAIKESYKDVGEGKTLSQIFEDLESLVSPAVIKLADGDPNAGNKPLVIAIKEIDEEQSAWEKSLHESSLRALKTVWWNAKHGKSANGGESQALQAAILGLHTLAGEFPTPTWKTREDYLQATISEINEIIGKQ